MSFQSFRIRPSATRQRGAVLFISMMLLIVLSVLALSASQVTSLQERMASTYRADELAFERSEGRLRQSERDIVNNVDPCFQSVAVNNPIPQWQADVSANTEMAYTENLSRGPASRALAMRGSIQAGKPAVAGDAQCIYFRVSSRDFDTEDRDDSTSESIVQSMYVP